MRIDILTYSLRGGGAERVAINLANGWHKLGHEVRVITIESVHPAEYQPTAGIELVSCVGSKGGGVLRRLMRIRQALVSGRPDVVVAVQANMAIEAALAAVGLGLRIVGCEHSAPARAVRGWIWQALRPFAYHRLSAVTTLTAGAADELRKLCGDIAISVIPNALCLPLTETEPHLEPSEFVPDGVHLLLAAGRMVEAKGFDQMITLFARLAPRYPDLRLVILGDGPLMSSLTQQVDSLGLSGRVLLPGRAGNMSDWYKRASLYLMTSRWEGLPMVLLEAMGHGVPAVVTDFRYGPRDVIRQGIDGLIVPVGEPEAWASSIVRLLQDDTKRLAMAAEAKSVQVRFNEVGVMASWDALFDRLPEGAARSVVDSK